MAPSAVSVSDSTCFCATCWASWPYCTWTAVLRMPGRNSSSAVMTRPSGMSQRRHVGGGGGAGSGRPVLGRARARVGGHPEQLTPSCGPVAPPECRLQHADRGRRGEQHLLEPARLSSRLAPTGHPAGRRSRRRRRPAAGRRIAAGAVTATAVVGATATTARRDAWGRCGRLGQEGPHAVFLTLRFRLISPASPPPRRHHLGRAAFRAPLADRSPSPSSRPRRRRAQPPGRRPRAARGRSAPPPCWRSPHRRSPAAGRCRPPSTRGHRRASVPGW